MFGAGIDYGVGATVEIAEIESLAKGTIISGDGAGAPTTLAVGADDTILVGSAAAASGLRWATELKVSATAVTATVPYLAPNGSNSNPSFAFDSDPNTGFMWPVAADTIAVVCNSTQIARFTTAGLVLGP